MTVALPPPNEVGVAPPELVAPPPAAGIVTDWTGEAKLAEGPSKERRRRQSRAVPAAWRRRTPR